MGCAESCAARRAVWVPWLPGEQMLHPRAVLLGVEKHTAPNGHCCDSGGRQL